MFWFLISQGRGADAVESVVEEAEGLTRLELCRPYRRQYWSLVGQYTSAVLEVCRKIREISRGDL